MLSYLHIENIAVIESADIPLNNGFNVLTGETGAGKSIVIDSLNAVLGARTSKDLIRTGTAEALVIAEFTDVPESVRLKIRQLGFNILDDNIIIKRTMTLSGGSFRINDQPATAATVKEIAGLLINIHGQHDNQALLDPQKHINYIDLLAQNSNLLDSYREEFKILNDIRHKISALETDEDEKMRRIDILKYQIDELNSASIIVGEFDKLKEKLRIAKNREKILKALKNAVNGISGDDFPGAVELVKNGYLSTSVIDDRDFLPIHERFGAVLEDLNDVCAELENYLQNIVSEEQSAEEIEDRLDIIKTVIGKYGGSEQSAIRYLENAKVELEKINMSDTVIRQLEDELLKSQERLIKKADALSLSRRRAALKFEKDVCSVLAYLDMPNVKLCVDFKDGKYTKNGRDTVEFLLSANLGESLKPLLKVASGGELSRVMLSIKSVLADKDDIDTLIFDEIDVGLSGRAASKVADQLKNVAKNRQVICITHLAQIAAAADNHLLIQKSTKGNKTVTDVLTLSYENRIKELARIMSGTDISENIYNSAKELLDRSCLK